MAMGFPLLLFLALAAALVGVEPSDALQLHEMPTLPGSAAASQKLIIALRDRLPSRSDAEDPGQLSQETRTQRMTTASGQRYTCKIPLRSKSPSTPADQPHDDTAAAAASDLVPQDPAAAEEGAPTPKSPSELLEQLSALCLYRQEGMWTYEVCYKKHTRQFRQAMHRIIGGTQAETITAEDFSCGKFTPDDQDFSVKFDFSATGMPMTYVSHRLSGGAPCVMTGASRTSEVRFTCMPHAKDNLLVLVKEFPTCNYIYVVATPLLCAHPQFQPRPQRTHTIRCAPEEPGAAGAGAPPPPPAAVLGGGGEGKCQEGGEEESGSCAAEGGAGEAGEVEEGEASEPELEEEGAGGSEEEEEDSLGEEEAEQSASSEAQQEEGDTLEGEDSDES